MQKFLFCRLRLRQYAFLRIALAFGESEAGTSDMAPSRLGTLRSMTGCDRNTVSQATNTSS